MITDHLDRWPLPGPVTFGVVFLTLYFILYGLSSRKTHPKEPPVITSPILYVGHLLGMAMRGGSYIKSLGLKHRGKPVFTLPVPLSRIYIVTDPSLAAAVQRASRSLSFTPLVPDVTKRVLGLDDATISIVRQNLDPEPGEPRGFLADMHDMVYSHLGPGDALERMTMTAAYELSNHINDYADTLTAKKGSDSDVVDLLLWIRHFVTVATANFLYGPRNPIALHPELEEAFWYFDHGLGSLLMNMLPSVTARKAFRGREALVKALATYLEAGHHKNGASSIVQKRVKIAEQYGWTTEATARSEVSFLFAGIVNTATATFWTVLHIFVDPELLVTVRDEVLGSAITSGTGDKSIQSLSLNAVRTACPTLAAVFRECLRLGSDNFSIRLVKTDTLLAEQYFLQANSVVQVAAGVIHADTSIWGPDAGIFNHRRFLKTGKKGKQQKDIHPAAFRAFGGGKTLCPGRHFATSEILSFVAMIVLQFDIEGAGDGDSGKGVQTLKVPKNNDKVLPVHILEPKAGDVVRVRIRLHGGHEGKRLSIVP